MMLKEPVVLGCEERLYQAFRQLLIPHGNAALVTDGGDQAPVAGVHAQGHLKLHIPQAAYIG